jgi:probable HAF family extracellular repeat protein
VGDSVVDGHEVATEWSGGIRGSIINLGGLPGFTDSAARSINDNGLVVGDSGSSTGDHATEWSSGSVIDLGGLPGSKLDDALSVNNAGQAVGQSGPSAAEWSDGAVIELSRVGFAYGINDAGVAVGETAGFPPLPVPEPSTWAMMLAGFAGLGLTGYRRAKARGPVSASSAD